MLYHLPGPHVIGRRIDHVAGQGAGVRQSADLDHVDAGRGDEARRASVTHLLVTVEPIGAQRPSQGDVIQPKVRRPGLDAIVALRQLGGKAAKLHRLGAGALAQAKEHTLQGSVGAGNERNLTSLSAESRHRGCGLDAGRSRRLEGRPIGGADRHDRRGFSRVMRNDGLGHLRLAGRYA